MADWNFLTNHARAIVFIAANPDARIRDLADALEVTERTAFAVVDDLVSAGYVVKEKEGRRNRYHIQADRPLDDPISAERTVGELLGLLVRAGSWPSGEAPAHGVERRLGDRRRVDRAATVA